MVKGPCSGKHKRFYYNAESGDCEQFEYGGCLGNTNNFMQIADCEAKCTSVDQSEWNCCISASRIYVPSTSLDKLYFLCEAIASVLRAVR